MTDIVATRQLMDAEWHFDLSHDRNAKPLPGICRMVCLDYPATFQFHWQVLEFLDETSTQYERDVDPTPLGCQLKLDGIRLAVGPSGREVSIETAASDLYNELVDNYTWAGVVRDEYPELFVTNESDLETITLENGHGPNYRFQGEQLAHVSSRKNDGTGSTRWTELKLYRTKGGKLVCHELGMTLWDGEEDRYTVYLADDEASLIEKVGLGSLAKDLYDVADIDHAQEID